MSLHRDNYLRAFLSGRQSRYEIPFVIDREKSSRACQRPNVRECWRCRHVIALGQRRRPGHMVSLRFMKLFLLGFLAVLAAFLVLLTVAKILTGTQEGATGTAGMG